jgi:thiamine-monophosphate kinase
VSPALGAGPEFDRIRAIAEALGDRASGLGDDCSFIPADAGFFAVSTDISVEGVHFRREWLSPEEIGWRAAAGALSDLAAVGANPVGILTSVALPLETHSTELVALMEGMATASEAVGAKILGGDLARSATLTIDVTVIGKTDAPVRRSGAQPGDGLWVTGTLGGSRAALQAWQRGESPEPALRNAFAHPSPRVAAGRWLAQ